MAPDPTADLVCEVCQGATGAPVLGVASVPGAPVSIAWCQACVTAGAVPSWIFDHDWIFVADGHLEALAEWARERVTWADGRYMPFEEYVTRWTPEKVAAEQARYAALQRAAAEANAEGDRAFPPEEP